MARPADLASSPFLREDGTLAEAIAAHAARIPDAPALLCEGASLSWRGYHERSDRLARALRSLDLEPGAHVGVLLPDGIAVHVAYVGVEKAGAVIVGVSSRAGARELEGGTIGSFVANARTWERLYVKLS